MRKTGLGLALLLATGSAFAAPQDSGKTVGKDRQVYFDAAQAYDRKDCPTVLKLLAGRLDSPGTASDPERLRAIGYELATLCAWRGEDVKTAHRYALAGTALDAASDELWRNRFGLELDGEQYEAAVATVEAMTQGRGKALNQIPLRWFHQLNRNLERAKLDSPRERMLRILTDNAYDPEEVLASKDWFRRDYAELLVAKGDSAGAAAQVVQIADPRVSVPVSLDPRFRAMMPKGYDPRAATEASLANAREQMLQHPDLLEPIIETAYRLRQLGRPKEALAVLETARAGSKPLAGYGDADERLNWWWDAVARTQVMLGDADATIAAFREGVKAGEGSTPNVSQSINLAEMQNRLGRSADALVTLKPFDGKMPISPYGEMEMRFTRGCANALLGNAAAAKADRAFVEAHVKDAPEALSDLLLCMNDMDAAAASFIRRLDDPDERGDALLQLCDFDPPPPSEPVNPIDARLPVIKARPDVKAAVARAGGTRNIPLQRGEL